MKNTDRCIAAHLGHQWAMMRRQPQVSKQAELHDRRETLGVRLEKLAVDARSEWQKTRAELEAQIAELTNEVDAALDAFEADVDRWTD
jgi:hypothetical protein